MTESYDFSFVFLVNVWFCLFVVEGGSKSVFFVFTMGHLYTSFTLVNKSWPSEIILYLVRGDRVNH